jgi:putative transposase
MIKRFNLPEHYEIVLRNIEFYRRREKASVLGYVIMPDHFHLLINMPATGSISNFMRDLKRRTVYDYSRMHGMKSGKFWQDRFNDVSIYSEEVLYTKLKYIHENPVRAGLAKSVLDWKYSSAAFYKNGQMNIIEISDYPT